VLLVEVEIVVGCKPSEDGVVEREAITVIDGVIVCVDVDVIRVGEFV
jgi:hypothetical protein